MSKAEVLLNELKALSLRVHELDEKIDAIYGEGYPKKTNLPMEEETNLYTERNNLYDRLTDLAKKILWMIPPVKSNGVIEIRKKLNCTFPDPSMVLGDYSICLANTNRVVGTIQYRGYHFHTFLGDVGYNVYPEYRGHNFAYQALCLLSDVLSEKHIEDFWISADKDNTPSVRTIEKFGGVPIQDFDSYLLFVADTNRSNLEIHGKRR